MNTKVIINALRERDIHSVRAHIFSIVFFLFFLCLFPQLGFANDGLKRLDKTKPVSASVQGTDIDKYVFKMSQGKSLVLNLRKTDEGDTSFKPMVKLLDPGKNVFLEEVQDFVFRAPIMMPPEGEWTVEVRRGDKGKTGGGYELRVIEVPGAKGSKLQLGQSVTGSLVRGVVDIYNIQGMQDALGELTLISTGDAEAISEVTLVSPMGDMMGATSCTDRCQLELPVVENGIYTLMVWRMDQRTTKTEYALKTNMMPGMHPTPYASGGGHDIQHYEMLENMKPITAAVERGAIKRYRFHVAERSHFIVGLSERGKDNPQFKPDLKIFDPNNNLLHADGGEHFVKHHVHAMVGGDWIIEAGADPGGESGGGYILNLVQVPGAKGQPMTFKKTYKGSILRGETDVYIIRGTPNVLGRIMFKLKEKDSFTPEMIVIAPNGEVVNRSGCSESCHTDLAMLEYGDYTILLGRVDDSDQKGTYEISVKRTDGRPEISKADIKRAFRNPTIAMLPEQMRPMGRSANVYRGGMFLPLTSKKQSKKDRGAAKSGDVLAQLHMGDCSLSSGQKFAREWWKKAAEQDNVLAHNRLGVSLSDKTYKTASWYRRIVEQGAQDQAFKHANRFLTGCGYIQDFPRMKKEMRVWAEKGVAAAQFNLAVLYALGMKDAPDFVKAAKWYGKAAEQGMIVALNNLGELYEHGDGVAQNDAQAVKLYRKAAESGYPRALYNLGRFASTGRGMRQDLEKAKTWLRQAADEGYLAAQASLYMLEGDTLGAQMLWYKMAEYEDMDALHALVKSYRDKGIPQQRNIPVWGEKLSSYLGKGTVWKDYHDVLRLYRQAATQVNPIAFVGLGDLFTKQETPDYFEAYSWYSLALDSIKAAYFPKDEKTALKRYAQEQVASLKKKLSPEQIAVAKGRIDDRYPLELSKKQKKAGRIFLRAEEAYKEDDLSEFFFYFKAALMDQPQAQLLTGMYLEGKNNYKEAIKFYKKAIANGRVQAATSIGELYHFGLGVPQDLNKAAEWYELDASRGYKTAIDRLGVLYASGLLENSGKKAVTMYEKAAARGIYQANNALGMIYFYGIDGVAKNHQKALEWYLKSAEAGSSIGAIQAAIILIKHEPHDYERALELLSDFTTPVTLNNRGYMYEHGLGVKEHMKKHMKGKENPTALDFYKRASDMCYGRAMYNIGRLYEKGTSEPRISEKPIKKDLSVARMWMEDAVMNGSQAAKRWLKQHDDKKMYAINGWDEGEVILPPEPCKKKGR